MSEFFSSAGYIIDPQRRTIEKDGETTPVRARTFELLLIFLRSPKQLISKQLLLDAIWDDVTVDEQVLFQSIRELRLLFKQPEIIKNYPRKGYAWIDQVTLHQHKFLPPHGITKKFTREINSRIPIVALLLIGTISLAAIHTDKIGMTSDATTLPDSSNAQMSLDGSIIVLPFSSNIQSQDHQWVRLGAMDQVIAILKENSQQIVRSTEIVLELIGQINNPQQNKLVPNIFKVTDAAMVVEANLSGNVEEYRLNFVIHAKSATKRGVIFDTNIDKLLLQFANVVSTHTGTKDSADIDKTYESDFRSELISRAFNAYEQQQYKEANSFFNSVIAVEPHNLIARRKYAETLAYIGQPHAAKESLQESLPLATGRYAIEKGRMYYWLSLIDYHQNAYSQSLATLEKANKVADAHSDWLYQAYIADLKGLIYTSQSQYVKASASFTSALKHYGDVYCPIGRTRTHLHLANLHFENNNVAASKAAFAEADFLFTTYKLLSVETIYKDTQQRLNASTDI
ncbi:winged helix-turn-helix domain-containing protein [Agaribacter marinus]|uniref:OmpR/PhoB-type domain-containing protein n=1 Tax=Agaribacter marinus TaxID=1431249 RepID=A0AA37WIC5_9ALTE|nr:winged helix-turn-helix domain-containing protein [Agaribacter marinus]GLR69364.1 hypothetical protein GCM10007852_02720 [Agaribacter marinus]